MLVARAWLELGNRNMQNRIRHNRDLAMAVDFCLAGTGVAPTDNAPCNCIATVVILGP